MINVIDIAYIRCAVPDLEIQKAFHDDFGLTWELGSDGRLYARGTDPSPYCYVSEVGDPALVAVGFEAASLADLDRLAGADSASPVEPLDGPGGGSVVRLADPDGLTIEVVHGRAPAEQGDVVGAEPINRGSDRVRLGRLQRVPKGPARVKRLGHCVLIVTDFARSRAWYQEHLGFVDSDEVYVGDEDHVIMSFMRCNLGDDYTDHHTLALAGGGSPALEHAAFEVEDPDAVMAGHDHLLQTGRYTHARGIGRHVLGSQVFDYWQDPWGQVVEHYADGDRLNADTPTAREPIDVALGTQWGSMAPAPQ